jgi:hypothetical protein
MHVTGLLCDMDGLFRHWCDTGARTDEQLAQLPPGTIDAYTYRHPSYRLAQLGILTDQQWGNDVTQRLVNDFGPIALAATGPWRACWGEIDAKPMAAEWGRGSRRSRPGQGVRVTGEASQATCERWLESRRSAP